MKLSDFFGIKINGTSFDITRSKVVSTLRTLPETFHLQVINDSVAALESVEKTLNGQPFPPAQTS